MNKISEKTMVEIFEQNLLKQQIKPIKELPFEGTKIDLSYLNKNNLHGIEFKLNNFKKLLYQASRIQFLFNYVYICIPTQKNEKNIEKKIQICKEKNIGLILFDVNRYSFKRIFKPKRNAIKLKLINKNAYIEGEELER